MRALFIILLSIFLIGNPYSIPVKVSHAQLHTIAKKDTTIVMKQYIPVADGAFLSFSDLHFDPFAFWGLTDTLMKSPATQWKSIFQSAAAKKGFGNYGDDTNYNLFISALEKMKATNPHPDFIVMSGDFISHDFGSAFQNNTGIRNKDSLFKFIYKTFVFVTGTIESYFPGITLFPVLGNNDSYCGDYQAETSGKFYNQMGDLWYPLLKKVVSRKNFMNSFSNGGYYMTKNPTDSQHNIIALNTVELSSSYNASKYPNFCNPPRPDSAGFRQLSWLKKQLQQCRKQRKRAWILFHIPPGINAYASAGGGMDCASNVTGFWKDNFNKSFISLVSQYKDVIQLNMAGHSHMDNFQVFMDTGFKPYNFVHLTPAISPIFGNNPAFEEISYIRKFALWKDYTTYYFKDFSQPIDSLTTNPWNQEYSFSKTYDEILITNESLKRSFLNIYIDSAVQKNYLRYYNVSNTSSPIIVPANFMAYWCAIGFLDKTSYVNCACNNQTGRLLFKKTTP